MLAFWALLLVIGWIDWHHRRIPNNLCALLVLSIVCEKLITGQSITISQLLVNVGIALLLTLPGYLKGVLGGGDVKLMIAVALAWPPLFMLQAFAIGVLSLVLLMIAMTYLTKSPALSAPNAGIDEERTFARGLPLGTAVAMGGIVSSALSTML